MQLLPHLDELARELETRGIETPALVIDLDAVDHNLAAMIERCGAPERWRPHIKTHKQSAILRRALHAGLRAFKCATFTELELLLEVGREHQCAGELDILLAYNLHGPGLQRIAQLARENPTTKLAVLANDVEQLAQYAQAWSDADSDAGPAVGVYIDVDVGMGRTGMPPEYWQGALPQLNATREQTRSWSAVVGVHGYEGHLSWQDTLAAASCHAALRSLVDNLAEVHPRPERGLTVVTSGTHGYGHALNAWPAHFGEGQRSCHQVSPGTIVLSDLRSEAAVRDANLHQAALVLSRAIARTPHGLTLDAGSKALSPDVVAPNCIVVGHEDWIARSPSEEHLPIATDVADPQSTPGEQPVRGSLFWLVPQHICTTVNLYRHALLVRSGQIVGTSVIESGHRGGLSAATAEATQN